MCKNNAELTSIIPFKEDGRWYLKLIYKYEDKKGKHTAVIPKADVPFDQGYIPPIKYFVSTSSQRTSERPYINCSDEMTLYESICSLASERGITKPAYLFDIITEYASREMTLDEIEKELGYKVKIINKEEKNA